MSDRGLTLLSLCALPVDVADRYTIWARLLDAPQTDLAHLSAQLRDYARRHWVTTDDFRTAELTPHGQIRYQRGRDLRAGRT
jgi:hypothetical protein